MEQLELLLKDLKEREKELKKRKQTPITQGRRAENLHTMVMVSDFILSHRVEKVSNNGNDIKKPLDWLLRDKLGIVKGSTYREPKITVRQCASWIHEYMKLNEMQRTSKGLTEEAVERMAFLNYRMMHESLSKKDIAEHCFFKGVDYCYYQLTGKDLEF